MEVVRELKEIPNLSLALGFFDGIHLGHQAVIKCAVDFATEVGCKSAVVSFKEHPYCYFKGVQPKYILTLQDKYKYRLCILVAREKEKVRIKEGLHKLGMCVEFWIKCL